MSSRNSDTTLTMENIWKAIFQFERSDKVEQVDFSLN